MKRLILVSRLLGLSALLLGSLIGSFILMFLIGFWLSVGYGIIGFLIVSIFGPLISSFIDSAFNPLGMVSWIVSISLGWVSTVHISSLIVKGYQDGKLSITKN